MGLLAYLIISMAIFLIFVALAIVKNNIRGTKTSFLSPTNYLIIGTFLSAFVLFIPIYKAYFGNNGEWFRIIALSLHNTLRLFVVDVDFDAVYQLQYLSQAYAEYSVAYQSLFAVYYVLAPLLTFGFVLSLFQNMSAKIKLSLRFFSNVYVFSDLNDKAISLASDIFSKKKKATFVFTNVNNKERVSDLLEQANGLGAIVFSKSILSINFAFHSKSKKISFFMIGENEEENIARTSALIEKYKQYNNCNLFLFSNTKQSELLLDCLPSDCQMKIRRINGPTSLINRYLFDNGSKLLNGAHAEEKGQKVISAVIIGMGEYGVIMAKTLPWFCQLPNYRFKMNVFDENPSAEDVFRELCPEFLSEECNRVYVEGEAQYDISFHSSAVFRQNTYYKTNSFGLALEEIKQASFVFVDLGEDEKNISCALMARMHFERIGIKPEIVTCVVNKDKIKHIENATANDGKSFDISYISTLDELYSAKVIINSELEKKALKVHMSYPVAGISAEEHERNFWLNEYNYNSSCASALHEKIRVECGIAGADKKDQLTEEQRQIITITEHRRWNAYVRSCGYVYSGNPEKSSRNEIAKKHNCLIPFKDLSEEYQKIDADVTVDKK